MAGPLVACHENTRIYNIACLKGEGWSDYKENLQASQDGLMAEDEDIFLSFELHNNRL